MGCKSMPLATSGSTKYRFLAVDGAVTVDSLEELKKEMQKSIRKNGSYMVDLSKIVTIDPQGVQLIYSLFIQLNRDEKPFMVKNASDSVKEMIDLLQIDFPQSEKVFYPPNTEI